MLYVISHSNGSHTYIAWVNLYKWMNWTVGRDKAIYFSKICILFSNYPNLSLIFILIGCESIDEIKFPYKQKEKKKKENKSYTNIQCKLHRHHRSFVCLFFSHLFIWFCCLHISGHSPFYDLHQFVLCSMSECSFSSFLCFSTNYFGTQSSFERFTQLFRSTENTKFIRWMVFSLFRFFFVCCKCIYRNHWCLSRVAV